MPAAINYICLKFTGIDSAQLLLQLILSFFKPFFHSHKQKPQLVTHFPHLYIHPAFNRINTLWATSHALTLILQRSFIIL